jgi:hypothetical protein
VARDRTCHSSPYKAKITPIHTTQRGLENPKDLASETVLPESQNVLLAEFPAEQNVGNMLDQLVNRDHQTDLNASDNAFGQCFDSGNKVALPHLECGLGVLKRLDTGIATI